jgi:hypothetical protein
MERALSGPTAADEELMPTLIEDRPTAVQLGLEPSADERVRTEPQRMPAFGPRPSSTAPSDPVRGVRRAMSGAPAAPSETSDGNDGDAGDGGRLADQSEDEAITAELPAPEKRKRDEWAGMPKTAPPPAPGSVQPGKHRISTGASRRVVSLEGDEEHSGSRPRRTPPKPK